MASHMDYSRHPGRRRVDIPLDALRAERDGAALALNDLSSDVVLSKTLRDSASNGGQNMRKIVLAEK